MKRADALLLLSTLLLCALAPARADAAVYNITGSSTTHYLYDDAGRVRLFQGMNFVQKGFPWYDATLLDAEVAAQLQAWGVSVVRLGLMWTGAQPSPGQFNQSYYDIMQRIVGNLAAHGIYTLLDMHQDGLSSVFCLYDGVPLWVIEKSRARRAFPWPLAGNCSSRPWAANELTEAAGQAYQDLYDNTGGMLDDLKAFWEHSAAVFADVPGILGYEFINEPFAGDIYRDPALLLPGVAGRQNLQRLYDALLPAIRRGDARRLVFYEPVTWGMVLNGKVVGSGFDHVPGGPEQRALSVFSFHYYCWLINAEVTRFVRAACDAALGPEVFRAVAQDVQGLGGAAFLTEFGADSCASGTGNATECIAVMDLSLRHWISWINWPGAGIAPQPLGLTRPYPRALAGTPLNASFAHDSPARRFQLCFQPDAAIASPTEIYADLSYYYPQGAAVQHTANVEVSVRRADNVIEVRLAAGAQQAGEACVVVVAGSGERDVVEVGLRVH